MQIEKSISEAGREIPATIKLRMWAAITTLGPVIFTQALYAWIVNTIFPFYRCFGRFGVLNAAPRVCFAVVILMFPIIWFVIAASAAKATYGMRKRKLWFSDINGQPVSAMRCFVRIVTGIATIPLLPASLIYMLADPQKRSLADRISRTVVWTLDDGGR